jgi:tetratricopeptide (TPR) repeat protein
MSEGVGHDELGSWNVGGEPGRVLRWQRGVVRVVLAARRGRMDEALASVADALALADRSEYYDLRAPSLLLFAQLLLDAGRLEEARAHAQQVLDLARPRGDVLFESRATDLLDRLAVLRPAAN